MAMQINGNYNQSPSNYVEQMKEKQAAEKAGKAEEANREKEEKTPGELPHDEYISREKENREPVGLYRVGQDQEGNRKIFFNDPNKADPARKTEGPRAEGNHREEDAAGKAPRADENKQGKSPETCVGNTDAVEREIRKLKEKKQQLQQQMQAASGDEKKIRELEKKLAQVEQELGQKDTETYRRQHTVFS